MHYVESGLDSEVSVEGTISYVSQKPWIMNDTIRNNILFGSPFDEERYRDSLRYSDFDQDLERMPDQDLSRTGENGDFLSGGQKIRLCIAQALYSGSEIIFFDDILR